MQPHDLAEVMEFCEEYQICPCVPLRTPHRAVSSVSLTAIDMDLGCLAMVGIFQDCTVSPFIPVCNQHTLRKYLEAVQISCFFFHSYPPTKVSAHWWIQPSATVAMVL